MSSLISTSFSPKASPEHSRTVRVPLSPRVTNELGTDGVGDRLLDESGSMRRGRAGDAKKASRTALVDHSVMAGGQSG